MLAARNAPVQAASMQEEMDKLRAQLAAMEKMQVLTLPALSKGGCAKAYSTCSCAGHTNLTS